MKALNILKDNIDNENDINDINSKFEIKNADNQFANNYAFGLNLISRAESGNYDDFLSLFKYIYDNNEEKFELNKLMNLLNKIFYDNNYNIEGGEMASLHDYFKEFEPSLDETKKLKPLFYFYFDLEFILIQIKKNDTNLFISKDEIIKNLIPTIHISIKYTDIFVLFLSCIFLIYGRLNKNIQIIFHILEELKTTNIKFHGGIISKEKPIDCKISHEDISEYFEEQIEFKFVRDDIVAYIEDMLNYHFKESYDLFKEIDLVLFFCECLDFLLNEKYGDKINIKYKKLISSFENIKSCFDNYDNFLQLIKYFSDNVNTFHYTKELIDIFFLLQYLKNYNIEYDFEKLAGFFEFAIIENSILLIVNNSNRNKDINILYMKKNDDIIPIQIFVLDQNLFIAQMLLEKINIDKNYVSINKNIYSDELIITIKIEINEYFSNNSILVSFKDFKDKINKVLSTINDFYQKKNLRSNCFFNLNDYNRCLSVEECFQVYSNICNALNNKKYNNLNEITKNFDLLLINPDKKKDEEEEQLISVIITSSDKKIIYSAICKKTDLFKQIERKFYQKYSHYEKSNNYFIVNGKQIDKNLSLEKNGIMDNDIVTININDK